MKINYGEKFMIRICLRCNKEFKSYHIGNRICPNCNLKNQREGRLDTQTQGRRDNIKGLRNT